MDKETRYVIAFAQSTGNVMCTIVIDWSKSSYNAEAAKQIRNIFAHTLIMDFAVIWRQDDGPITKDEQTEIAKRMRDAVVPGWTKVTDTTILRGGKFGRKYIKSETCMVVQWNELRLPFGYAHWSDFVSQCRLDAQAMIKDNRTGLGIMTEPEFVQAVSEGDAQRQRESDPGYEEQVKDHATRHNETEQHVLDSLSNSVMRNCTKLIRNGNYAGALEILSDHYDVPKPKTSSDVFGYPFAYAFYDTTSRTIVHLPGPVSGAGGDVMSIMAGFYRYVAQYNGYRFHSNPTSSLNCELKLASEFAERAARDA